MPGYDGLRVELPAPGGDRRRGRRGRPGRSCAATASSADVERPAARGDFVTLDLDATRDGEDVAGLNTEDWSYEIGQGWVADDFDDQLIGAVGRRRADVHHDAQGHRGAGRLRRHRVAPCRSSSLPELDRRVRRRELRRVRDRRRVAGVDRRAALGSRKLNQARQELVGRVTEALTGLTEIEPPEPLVQSDLQRRVEGTVRQLQSQGIDVEQWLSITGQDANGFVESMQGASPSRPSRSTSRCAPSPSPRASTPTRATSPSSTSGWRCSSTRSRTRSARPTSRTTSCPSWPPRSASRKALDWLLHHVEMVDPDGNAARPRRHPRPHPRRRRRPQPRPRPRRTTTTTHDARPRPRRRPVEGRRARTVDAPESTESPGMNFSRTTSSPTSSSRRAAASGPTTSTAGC